MRGIMNSHEVTAILQDLVGFRTISSQSNGELIDYLEHHLKPLGFETIRIKSEDEPFRYNLLCRIGPDKEGGLMLSGHTDVVPTTAQAWHSDPFSLTAREGRLYGRGSADMKGFIAATLVALKHLRARLNAPLTLLWTYDEEIGCLGSQQAAPMLKNYLQHVPSAALIGEPTDFSILRMHAGHVTVKIAAKGKGVHSSDPDLGVSAIKAIHRALLGIFSLEDQLRHEVSLEKYFRRPYVILNVGEVHGGTAVNIVPDEASITLGFRPLPDTSIETMMARINEAIVKHAGDSKAKISSRITRSTPPMITKEGGRLEQIVQPFAKKGAGVAAQFSTDGGNLSQSGIECLIYGPGTIDIAHQANEWILTKDLEDAVDNIAAIINKWFA
jgi:acetylornithine deacetylase